MLYLFEAIFHAIILIIEVIWIPAVIMLGIVLIAKLFKLIKK